jgi:hypothetical protein
VRLLLPALLIAQAGPASAQDAVSEGFAPDLRTAGPAPADGPREPLPEPYSGLPADLSPAAGEDKGAQNPVASNIPNPTSTVAEQDARDTAAANLVSFLGVTPGPTAVGGAAAYSAAAAAMYTRHRRVSYTHTRIQGRLRSALLSCFPAAMLDPVSVVWGAVPLDRWGPLCLFGTGSSAQTFGYNIYMSSRHQEPLTRQQVSTLVHELVHTRQYVARHRSLHLFGANYFQGWEAASFSYENNPFEVEAYGFEERHEGEVWSAYDQTGQ